MSCVNDKISGVFVTVKRQLRDGEIPKRPHETFVYEATNELSSGFKDALASGKNIQVSWKIDGTCCKIENGIYYRRRDIRFGSVPPDGSILGDIVDGQARIAWIPLNSSNDPDDKNHLSAFGPDRTSVWMMNEDGSTYLMPLLDIKKPTTFEYHTK